MKGKKCKKNYLWRKLLFGLPLAFLLLLLFSPPVSAADFNGNFGPSSSGFIDVARKRDGVWSVINDYAMDYAFANVPETFTFDGIRIRRPNSQINLVTSSNLLGVNVIVNFLTASGFLDDPVPNWRCDTFANLMASTAQFSFYSTSSASGTQLSRQTQQISNINCQLTQLSANFQRITLTFTQTTLLSSPITIIPSYAIRIGEMGEDIPGFLMSRGRNSGTRRAIALASSTFTVSGQLISQGSDPTQAINNMMNAMTVQNQTIINQNNQMIENQNKLNDELLDKSDPNVDASSTANQINGLLPPGPIDSMLASVASLFVAPLRSCSPISLPLPFVPGDLEIPCMSTILPPGLAIIAVIINGVIVWRCVTFIINKVRGLTDTDDPDEEVI